MNTVIYGGMNRFLYFAMLPVLMVIIVGQASFIPVPITLLWSFTLLVLYWRVRQQHVTAVPKLWQMGFVLITLALVLVQFGRLWGVEPGVAFLTTCLLGKCLETKSTRDLIVVFNFGFFVTASLFLHSQAMWLAALVLVGVVFGFIGLFRIQTHEFVKQGSVTQSLRQDAKHVLKSVSIALPLFLLLFMFFPRLPPVWSLPVPEDKSVTGISDRMSPGDIAQLSQSSALAFRITGDIQQLPRRSGLYWRAMVLDHYDGSTWTNHAINQQLQGIPQRQYKGFAYAYLPAQSGQKWVMSLEHSLPMQSRYALHYDGSIQPVQRQQEQQPIQLFWLSASQWLQQPLSATQQKITTDYLPNIDRKAQRLAADLWVKSGRDPKRYVQLVLNWYKQNGFVYTLSPGRLTYNRIDQFLFESRRGFCEHYASSFTMLMRYVGIPARVTVGYQGGQFAPDGKSWEVRQLDAHAWTEVWLDGAWQRIDPTAIIAPQRIDDGMQNYVQQNSQLFGTGNNTFRAQQFEWLKTARIWSDYVSYQWQSKVVGFDADAQNDWLKRLGLNSVFSGVLIIFIGLLLMGAAFIGWYFSQRYYAVPPFERALNKFNAQLAAPLQRQQAETIQQWMQRLQRRVPVQPAQPCFENVTALYARVHYANEVNSKQFEHFKRLLKDCSIALKDA